MTIRKKLEVVRSVLPVQADGSIVYALGDAEALALAGELGEGEARHADRLELAVKGCEAVPAPPDVADLDALTKWAQVRAAAFALLWDALEGQVVDGVTVIRRRS